MRWFRKRERVHFDYIHDIHSHVLPGVDDGVKTYEESVMVLKGLSKLGVKRVTCTSHVYFPSLMNGRKNLQPILENLRIELQKEGVEIELDLGAEYRVGEYMLNLIEQDEILSGSEKRVLVEHNFLIPHHLFLTGWYLHYRLKVMKSYWLIRSDMCFGRTILFGMGKS